MQKIIFLDIDGVMNNATTYHSAEHHHTWPEWPFIGLDRRLVPKLNQIVEATGAKVVLSSTWRKTFTPQEMQEKLRGAGLDPKVELIDRTPVFKHGTPRRVEIKDWMTNHPGNWIDSYVVIDDDSDASIEGHFVHTNHEDGLTDAGVAEAIRILGAK